MSDAVEFYTLRNARGISVRLMNYGATVVAIRAPDRGGHFDNVVLGFDSLAAYRAQDWYCGATIGRCAGRIAQARFALDGETYRLTANQGAHQLHGGVRGFDKVFWEARQANGSLSMRHVSPHLDEGYPGTLDTRVTYTLTDDDELIVEFLATCDRPTPVNLTHHSYFNLAGSGDILDHELFIDADRFAVVDGDLLPTGELRSVQDTPFDFRATACIGARLGDSDEQIKLARGYDHDFVLRSPLAARLCDPLSGRTLEVTTDQPVLHLYSGNYLEPAHSFLALEAQHFSDSPNQPSFPSVVLRPGSEYRARTGYRFSVTG